jgi:hypothetical protein
LTQYRLATKALAALFSRMRHNSKRRSGDERRYYSRWWQPGQRTTRAEVFRCNVPWTVQRTTRALGEVALSLATVMGPA